VREVSWDEAADRLSALRRCVFVQEQGVPESLEWDGLDPQCRHVVAESTGGEAIATGRLLPDGHIGRMAVLPAWHRLGVGSAVLAELVAMARRRGDDQVVLHAQTYVIDFYRRAAFEVASAPFMEAGIAHVLMQRRLL
jgi:predicted GNAT family N-acyltransferase